MYIYNTTSYYITFASNDKKKNAVRVFVGVTVNLTSFSLLNAVINLSLYSTLNGQFSFAIWENGNTNKTFNGFSRSPL